MKMNPVVHFEMPAEDTKRMSDFYAKTFGWVLNQMGPEMGNYVTAMTSECDGTGVPKERGHINGGFFQKNADNTAPSIVIAVDDIQKHMEKVADAGGIVIGEPVEIPGVGQYVSFTDTEGNRASMLQPAPRTAVPQE
ncbi:MAG: VOC family protein [Patescibacteria group bacterium]